MLFKVAKKLIFSFIIFFVAISLFSYDKNRSNFDYHYRQINTQHFKIVFEKADYDSAIEIASFCEEVYENITKLLDSYPKKIDVLLHGRIDAANGSYYPIPEMLNLYLTTPSDSFHGAKTENYLKALLTPELTHYVQISYQKGWLYELSKFFGPSIKSVPGAFLPSWMLEGYTTNTETIFTQGGRGRNALFELFYKSNILESNFWTLGQSNYNHTSPPQNRIYVSGYTFVNFLLEKYGESLLKDLNYEIVKNPFAVNKAVKKITGKTTEELFDLMRLELTQKYAPYMQKKEGERATPYKKSHYYYPIKTDKGFLVYANEIQEKSSLSFFDDKNKTFTHIKFANLTDSRSYTASKSGEKIIFSAFDANAAAPRATSYCSDLFLIEIGEKTAIKNERYKNIKTRRLTKGAHLWHPAISGNGNKLVAVQKKGVYSNLVEVDLNSGEVKELVKFDYATIYNPALNFDGTKIAFIANIRGKQDLWLFENGKCKPLTIHNEGSEYFPSFADEENITFTSDENNCLQVFNYNLLTNQINLLLDDKVGVLSCVKSDTSYLYSTYRSNGYCLFSSTAEQEQQSKNENLLSLFYKSALAFTTIYANDDGVVIANLEEENALNFPPQNLPKKLQDSFYPDVAKLIAFTPVPFNYALNSSSLFPWGIGAAFWAQSLDKASYVNAILTTPFVAFNPSINIDARFPLGPLKVTYKHEQQFGRHKKLFDEAESELYYESVFDRLSIYVPFYHHRINNNTFGFALTSGLSNQLLVENESPFHIFEASAKKLANFHLSEVLTHFDGITFLYNQSPSNDAIYSGNSFKSSLGAQFIFDLTQPQKSIAKNATIAGYFDNSFSMTAAPHHNIFGELNFGYANRPNVALSISPRGFGTTSSAYRGKGLATLGYNYQISNLDAPLFWSLSVQGIALAVFAQTQFWYDFAARNSTIDNYLYAGVELRPIFGWSSATFPVTVGINCRFDLSFNSTFSASRDIMPYFAVDASFITNFIEKKESFVPQNSLKSYKIN